MRVFVISHSKVVETDALPTSLPENGYIWIATARREFEVMEAQVQAALHSLIGVQIVDLHIKDLLNNHLPSHYDYTSQYDIMVFRRLGTSVHETDLLAPGDPLHASPLAKGGPNVLRHIDTSPVGFAVFDRILLTVHPTDCSVRDAYAARLLNATASEARSTGVRLPASPADLMLRVVNQMVDGYLDLRRVLTQQLDRWQTQLLEPESRFTNWSALLSARLSLHHLDEICEDQRAAVQDWIDSIETWPEAPTPAAQRELDLLKVRSRDVLEHIERVVHHVRRLQESAETTVQMHFSAQSNRTNDIMRTLTVLTAIFLPLNLIAGIFGMNFEFIPLLHLKDGFWLAMGSMVLVTVLLVSVFWRKSYLARSGK